MKRTYRNHLTITVMDYKGDNIELNEEEFVQRYTAKIDSIQGIINDDHDIAIVKGIIERGALGKFQQLYLDQKREERKEKSYFGEHTIK